MDRNGRTSVKGTKGLLYTIPVNDPIFGEAFDVFSRPTRTSTRVTLRGTVVPVEGGRFLAFAADTGHGSQEMSAGHNTLDAAAMAASLQTSRADAFHARLAAQIAATA